MGIHTSESSRLLPPWTPVEVHRDDTRTDIRTWGRAYRFDGSALPTGLTTQGQQLLAGPIRLAAVVDGQPITWEPGRTLLYHHDEGKAVLLGCQRSEKLLLNTAVTVEYDGMMALDIKIIPEGHAGDTVRLRLMELSLNVPLRPDLVRLFHYWPHQGMGTAPDRSAKNSGSIPPEGLALPFKPFLWLGWDEGGLGWFAESDRNWQPTDPERAIQVIPGDEATLLRLDLVAQEPVGWAGKEGAWRRQFQPLLFRMGFQATPVKPMPRDFHRWRTDTCFSDHAVLTPPHGSPGDGTRLDRAAAAGVRTMILHESTVAVQNSDFTDRPEVLSAAVRACHDRGLKVLVYFGYELSTLAPEWGDDADDVLVKSPEGDPAGGWRRDPPQRGLICCYRSRRADQWLESVIAFVDRYEIDGLYLDQTCVPFGCANEQHGCGYRGPDGALHVTFPIFAVRNLMNRLYEAMHARGAHIDVHQSSCCSTPTLAFAHSYVDGEHLIWDDQYKEDPAGAIGLDAFRAEFAGKNFGVPCEFFCETEAWCLPLLHDVRPRPGASAPEPLVKLWRVLDAFGVESAAWHPYWRNGTLLTVAPEPVKASAYVRHHPERDEVHALLVVANLAPRDAADAQVAVRFRELGAQEAGAQARDAMDDSPLEMNDGRLRLALGPLDTKLVLLRARRNDGKPRGATRKTG